MGSVVQVRSGETTFYAEVRDTEGASPAGLEALSLDGLGDTIRAVAGELQKSFDAVRPDEATLEFGLDLIAKSGKLTGLIVEGEGNASVKVTLTWKKS